MYKEMKDSEIKLAGEVSDFMMNLSRQFPEREYIAHNIQRTIPFGDMAYAQALIDWKRNYCPNDSAFYWAEDQEECAFTIEFRKEISDKFGLKILNRQEAKDFRKELAKRKVRIINTRVTDWGPN